MPPWGPYTKRYAGISHTPATESGLRFDLSIFPGLYRRAVFVPNVRHDSGFMPIEAAADLSYYRLRHGMPQMTSLYADIDYCRIDAQAVLVKVTFVNQTDHPEIATLHQMAALHRPILAPSHPEPLRQAVPRLPEDCRWIDALLDYEHLEEAQVDARSKLPYAGRRRGEFTAHDFVGGQGLGNGVLAKTGDRVRWPLPAGTAPGALSIRYLLDDGEATTLRIEGAWEGAIELKGNGELQMAHLDLPAGGAANSFTLQAERDANLRIDGFIHGPSEKRSEADFQIAGDWPEPERIPTTGNKQLCLRYPGHESCYGVAWDEQDDFECRTWVSDDLDGFMRQQLHNHVHSRLEDKSNPGGPYSEVYHRPIDLPAHSETSRFALLCHGSVDTVQERLNTFDPFDPKWETLHQEARAQRIRYASNPSGESYRESAERMAALAVTNLVYPIKRRSCYVHHHTPGRWWDTLYTWDAGFIALGLSHISREQAYRHIELYLSDDDRADGSAFVHYGTPVPTQFHAAQALLQRRPDSDWLGAHLGGFQSCHDFLLGRIAGSATRPFKSGLIATWDYFYNSGGWDDYPAQQKVHREKLTGSVAPVSNTAHAIRAAKWLRYWSRQCGEASQRFDEDIEVLSHALQKDAWDAESGYFAYVTHDGEGRADGILRDPQGVSMNRGLDGILPLISGICTREQVGQLVAKLFDPTRHWTAIGITTVDQSAPYYRPDGYWNGAVWFPHQWFLWKALLDYGYADEAHQLAETALQVWRDELARSGRCYEHFIVKGGRGAGWHQFSGLSCPVLDWFAAYHRPGHFTGGFDIMPRSVQWGDDLRSLKMSLDRLESAFPSESTLLVCLAPGNAYQIQLDGQAIPHKERIPGTLEISLPADTTQAKLEVVSEK